MNKVLSFLKGSIRVEITGYAPERFLNLCRKQGIPVWNLHPSKSGYVLDLSAASFFELRPLLRKSGTHVHIIKKKGIPFLCFHYRKHKCFFVGIVLCLLLLYGLSGFIWNVEISGNSYVTDQALKAYLKENGVGYGALKDSLQMSELEKMIRDAYPEIIWVSATVQGTRLIIDLQETMTGAQTDRENEEAQDLLAPVDGTVVSIVTREGMPQVEAGMEVKKGDVLVSGCIPYTNDNGDISGYKYVKADADVWIDGMLEYTDEFARETTMYSPTGKTRSWCRIYKGNQYLELGGVKQPFDISRQTSAVNPIVIGKNFYLPIQIQWFKEEAEEKMTRNLTKEEGKKQAKKNLAIYCKKMQENGFQIQQKDVKIKFNEKTVCVSGSFQVSVKADSYRKTELRILSDKEGQETNGIDTGSDGDSD